MTARNTYAGFERQYIPEPNSGCWLWIGHSPNGLYGSLKWKGHRIGAHVFSYLWHIGAISEGLEIDHLCRNTWCVNPAHLEAVTHNENIARSKRATQTQCHRGHPYADGVELYESETHRYRRCLTCYRMRYPRTTK